jgi:hypothetical protein
MNFSPIHKLKNKVKEENMSLAAKLQNMSQQLILPYCHCVKWLITSTQLPAHTYADKRTQEIKKSNVPCNNLQKELTTQLSDRRKVQVKP